MPTVSVIIPNYNHARFLRQRVDSVFGRSYQDFEVVLLDDCVRVLAPRGRLVISTPDKEVYTGRRRAWESLLSETPIGATDLPKSEQIAQISAKAEIQQRRWSLFAVRPL